MQYIPIKTRKVLPPKDDLLAVFDESLTELKEKDIVVVSSKVVAIHEGNCIKIGEVDKKVLVEQEAELLIPRDYWPSPMTVKANAFIGTAGIDESNADGHYILLPKEPFKSAEYIYRYLKEKFGLTELGVVISDSHSTLLRRGAIGVSIGYWGFDPLINCVGKKDLFGREMKIEVVNLVDGVVAGANVVMGETNECQPIVIARDVPNVTFSDAANNEDHLVKFEEDTFRVLYERFLP